MTAVSTARTLAVPLSQNTAEVFEFRCMFTHDLRRKQKRWQDGFLTYHTFNKRIIVYDESRNRVGDAHWRQDHEFGEGEELKLQQGVLIDVQDKLGSKEQDISGVIASRDTSKTPQLPSSRPSPWKAVTTVGPSGTGPRTTTVATAPAPGQGWRPKSLNEILQTPRAVLGRARLPESPYEQRHAMAPDVPAGREPVVMCQVAGVSRPAPAEESPRPKKKQRRDNMIAGPSTPKRTTSAPSQGKKAKTSLPRIAAAVSTNLPDNPIIIESDDEVLDDFTPDRPAVAPQSGSKTPTARTSKASTAPVSASKSSRAKPMNQTQSKRNAGKKTQDTQVLSAADELDRRANPLRERPVNTLRPASGQPRRKLIYRELLPSNFVSRNPRSQTTSTIRSQQRSFTPTEPSTSNRPSKTSGSTPRPTSRRSMTMTGDELALAESAVVAESRQPPGIPQTDPEPARLRLSPRKDSQRKPSPAALFADTDEQTSDALFDEGEHEPLFDPHFNDMDELAFDTAPPGEDSLLQDDPFPDDESLDMMEGAPTLADLAELDEALLAGKQQQLFRPASDLAKASVPPDPVQAKRSGDLVPVIAAANSRMLEETTKRSPWQRTRTMPVVDSPEAAQTRRSPLKKTNSDQTGRNNRPPEPIVADKDGEKGPWSREAFDLFGWNPGDSKAFITIVDLR